MDQYKNKRFIAGATCPKCNALDKVFTFERDGQSWRACVSCGFEESFASYSDSLEELPTRVNQHRLGEQPLEHETPLEAVRLIDPDNPKV